MDKKLLQQINKGAYQPKRAMVNAGNKTSAQTQAMMKQIKGRAESKSIKHQ